MAQSIEQRGQLGEEAFRDWLDDEGLGYLYINQDLDLYAALFKGNVKRPDFLVLLESIGMLAVDVKFYTLSGGVYTLKLEEEVRRVLAFERIFRIPVWYAYLGQDEVTWYWLSALKAIEVGEVRTNSSTGEEFLAIRVSEFEAVKTNTDLGKLYTHRLPSTSSVARVTP